MKDSKEGEKIKILRNTDDGSASPKASTHINASTAVESTTVAAAEISQSILLQRCLDVHTSMGSWEDGLWTSLSSEQMCPSFDKMRRPRDILAAFANLTIGFVGVLPLDLIYARGRRYSDATERIWMKLQFSKRRIRMDHMFAKQRSNRSTSPNVEYHQ